MNFVNQRTIYSGLFYLLIVTFLFVSKPSLVFDQDGEIKPFGIGTQKTLFSFGVLVIVIALLSFYVFAMIDLVFAK